MHISYTHTQLNADECIKHFNTQFFHVFRIIVCAQCVCLYLSQAAAQLYFIDAKHRRVYSTQQYWTRRWNKGISIYIYFVRVCVNHYKWQNLYGAFVYLALTKRAYILFCTMEFVVQRRAKCSDQPSNFVCMAFHLVLLQLLFLDLSINDPMMSVRGWMHNEVEIK